MNEEQFEAWITLILIGIIFGGLVLNWMAYRIMKRIAKTDDYVPEALKDRLEVTFWQLISSILLAILGVHTAYRIVTNGPPIFPPLVFLLMFSMGIALNKVPSARWLWRYYHHRFDKDG